MLGADVPRLFNNDRWSGCRLEHGLQLRVHSNDGGLAPHQAWEIDLEEGREGDSVVDETEGSCIKPSTCCKFVRVSAWIRASVNTEGYDLALWKALQEQPVVRWGWLECQERVSLGCGERADQPHGIVDGHRPGTVRGKH